MTSVSRIKRNETRIYFVMWLTVLLVCTLHITIDNNVEGLPSFRLGDLWSLLNVLVPLFIIFLINNYLLIPRLLVRHKIALYTVAAVLISALSALWLYTDPIGIAYIKAHQLSATPPPPPPHLPPHSHTPPPPHIHTLFPFPLLIDFIFSFLVVGINLAISLISKQLISSAEREQLIAANTSSRLEHLKTQISPHFYMNMLNNIHGLVDLNPEKAKETIIELSRLMQYMLNDSSRSRIPLDSELRFLTDYITIMRGRYRRANVDVNVSFPDPDSVQNISIPPLLFLVFIENAFKHGIDYREHSFVIISIRVVDNRILFECMNSIPTSPSDIASRSTGIGLQNIRLRLELLYGNRAQLDINNSDSKFTVSLNIPANEPQDSLNR